MALPAGFTTGLTKDGIFVVDSNTSTNVSVTKTGIKIELPEFIVSANTTYIFVGNSSHNTTINSTAVIAENLSGGIGSVLNYQDPPQVVNLFGTDYPIFGYYKVEDDSNANPASSHTSGLFVHGQMKAGHVGGLVSLTSLAEINEVPANMEAGAIILGHNNFLVHTANLRPFGVSLIMEGGSSAIVSGGGYRGAMAGYEIAIGAFGDSIPFAKFGLLIDDMGPIADTNHGTEWDARICLSSLNGVGARDQILLSDASGRHPFPADGSGNLLRIQAGAPPTINNGIDLRGAVVTGLAYASNGYAVTGAGYITVGNTTLNSAINATSVITTALSASIYIAQGSTGGAGQVLTAAGTGFASWEDPTGGGTPGGSNTEIQFNDSGAFGANVNFRFDKTASTLHFGNSTVNAVVNSVLVWIRDPSTNAFMESNEFTVGNSTVNTSVVPGGVTVGANVVLGRTMITVGNTTANLLANSIVVTVANTTGRANLQPTQLSIGSSLVTQTAMGVGANVFIDSNLFFAGNSTVNTTVNSAIVSVANAIGTASLLADGLVVGNATRLSTYDVSFATSPCLQLLGTGANGSSLTGSRFSNDTSAPSFIIAKSRGATVGDYTVVQDNDPLGRIVFEGSDGGSFIEGARIYAQIDGTPGDNDMPSELIFATTPDAGQAATDRWIIGPDGHFKAATDASFDIGTASLRPRNITASANVHAQSGLAPPIGGAAAFLCSSTAGLGIYFGANAPTISAAQGSIYIRTNGSSTTTRMYINTNGGTTWTAVNTVA